MSPMWDYEDAKVKLSILLYHNSYTTLKLLSNIETKKEKKYT